MEPVRQSVKECLGAFGPDVAAGLSLRHDHGSQYMSFDDLQGEIRFIRIENSSDFVCEPEGNSCAERFIRTLKENLLWVRSFETIEELRQALCEFKDRYNNELLIERHGNKIPTQVRREQITSLKEAA